MDPLVVAVSTLPPVAGALLGIFTGRGEPWRFVLSVYVLLVTDIAPLAAAGGVSDDATSLLWLRGGLACGWVAFAIAARLTRWSRTRQPPSRRSPFDLS